MCKNGASYNPISSHPMTRLLRRILGSLRELKFDDDNKLTKKMPYIPTPSFWAAMAILELKLKKTKDEEPQH